jgi:hypothetical protein
MSAAVATFATVLISIVTLSIWKIYLKPFFFSALRNLPEPEVSENYAIGLMDKS